MIVFLLLQTSLISLKSFSRSILDFVWSAIPMRLLLLAKWNSAFRVLRFFSIARQLCGVLLLKPLMLIHRVPPNLSPRVCVASTPITSKIWFAFLVSHVQNLIAYTRTLKPVFKLPPMSSKWVKFDILLFVTIWFVVWRSMVILNSYFASLKRWSLTCSPKFLVVRLLIVCLLGFTSSAHTASHLRFPFNLFFFLVDFGTYLRWFSPTYMPASTGSRTLVEICYAWESYNWWVEFSIDVFLIGFIWYMTNKFTHNI